MYGVVQSRARVLLQLSPAAHVSLSSMEEVTDATSRFSFTVDSVEALLPMDRRRWGWRRRRSEKRRGRRRRGGRG